MALAVGLDIGGTHVRAGLVDAAGRLLAQRREPCAREAGAVLGQCLRLVGELRTPEVAAVGAGLPGRVDAERGLALSGGYVDLSALPFAERLSRGAGLPVTVENDAAMALVAEAAVGAARGCASAVLLTVGTGVGGAVLERGRLLRGRRAAGQLGHLMVEPGGLPCLCGRRGCLETVAAGPALARHMAAAGLPAGTPAEALPGAPEGSRERAALLAWAGPLRRAVESLVAAFDPEAVVLGGGLGRAAAAALGELPALPSWYEAPVRAAALGDEAGCVGAGLRALDEAPGASSRRVLLVNGVPASGKSGVARRLADGLGWPLLALDTVKAPFLAELPPGGRPFNRTLGRASLRAMLAVVGEAPAGAGFVLDAWFGFQPRALLEGLLREAGVGAVAEAWCEAPPGEVGRRYAARAPLRPAGHPGADYVPELVALAARAAPLGLGPVLRLDTTRPLDLPAALAWAREALKETLTRVKSPA